MAPDTLSVEQVRPALLTRPEAGWAAVERFLDRKGALAGTTPGDALAQTAVTTQWFALVTDVAIGRISLRQTGLIDASQAHPRLASRQWGEGGMSDAIALFLPAHVDGAVALAGGQRRRYRDAREGLPDPEQPADTKIVAVAPQTPSRLHWADLPDRSLAQANAAARLLVAEASITPLGDLHVAVGQESGLTERPMVSSSAGQMVEWLAALHAGRVRAGVDRSGANASAAARGRLCHRRSR